MSRHLLRFYAVILKIALLVTVILCSIASHLAFASTSTTSSSVSHMELSNEAQALKVHLDKLKAFSWGFKQEVTASDGAVVGSSEGTIYLERPDNFLMYTKSPDVLALYLKDKDVYYYDETINQVSIFALDKMSVNPLFLMVYTDERFWDAYRVSQDGVIFTLVPKEVQDVNSITVAFSEINPAFISSITIRMDDGNSNFYQFTDLKQHPDPKIFDFKLPRDVEVDDER